MGARVSRACLEEERLQGEGWMERWGLGEYMRRRRVGGYVDAGELPCGDCFADSTPIGFNTLLQGAVHLGRLTGFACKSFCIVNPRGPQLKALCRQL